VIRSEAPGTCRPTRRIAEINCVMVSWVATASAALDIDEVQVFLDRIRGEGGSARRVAL